MNLKPILVSFFTFLLLININWVTNAWSAADSDQHQVKPAAVQNGIILDEASIHTVEEIFILIRNYFRLILRDPITGFRELFGFISNLLGINDVGDGVEGDFAIPGPGLGNLDYTEDEVFTPIGWINNENGVPGIYGTAKKPFGTNLGMMIDGYFFTLFAPDSGGGPGGFLFYDVSNPKEPQLIRRIYEPETRTADFREPHAFGLARINDRRIMVFQNIIGIEVWDFTDLNQLEKIAELDLPNVEGGDYFNVSWQLSFQAPYLYVASSEQGIFIVDLSDPLSPQLVDRGEGRPNPIPPNQLGGFIVGPIITFGNHMIISSMDNTDGFSSLDISDPINPVVLATVPSWSQTYYASCYDGEYMALSVRGSDALMGIFDLTDPSRFQLLDDDLPIPGQLYCAFQDDYLFQGTEEYLVKVDISDPTDPQVVGQGTLLSELVRLVDHGQVSPLGNLIFVGNDHGTGSAFMPHQANADDRPPRVKAVNPADGATNQNTLSRIALSFTDAIDFSSVNNTNFQVLTANGQAIAGTFSQQGNMVQFSPQQPLSPLSEYNIQVLPGSIQDAAGNQLTDAFQSSFSTGAGDGRLDVDIEIDHDTIAAGWVGDELRFSASLNWNSPNDNETLEISWQFGDGEQTPFSTNTSSVHSFDEPGHYQITALVRTRSNGSANGNGSDGAIKSKQISFTKTVAYQPTQIQPTQSSTLAVIGNEAFMVNSDNNTVTAVDLTTQNKLWENMVGTTPKGITRVGSEEIWVTLEGNDAIARLTLAGQLIDTIALPYGSTPNQILSAPNQAFVLVTTGSNQLLKITVNGEVNSQLSIEHPFAIAIDSNSELAYITRFISNKGMAEVYEVDCTAELTLVQTAQQAGDVTTVDGQDRARGLTNYLAGIELSPSGDEALIAAKKDNIYRGLFRDNQTLTHDTTVRAVLSGLSITPNRPDSGESASNELNYSRVMDFDNKAFTRATQFSPLGDYIFVALQGSNSVSVIDAYDFSRVFEIKTQLAPQALAIDNNSRLLVHNFMSRSLEIFHIDGILNNTVYNAPKVAEISLVETELLAANVLLGKQIFYNAEDARMSKESYLSCASCHFDGGQDGQAWDFTERGEGLRNTISLKGRAGLAHGNVHWTANFDEIQDFENDIRLGFGGTGFLSDTAFDATRNPLGVAKAGLSPDLDALANYVSSLDSFDRSPYREADGSLSENASNGQTLFQSLDCQSCHSGEAMTDGLRHQVNSYVAGSGQAMSQPLTEIGIETPTLKGLWNSAPYFHHGQTVDLLGVINLPGHGNAQTLNAEEKSQLVEYLNSLD